MCAPGPSGGPLQFLLGGWNRQCPPSRGGGRPFLCTCTAAGLTHIREGDSHVHRVGRPRRGCCSTTVPHRYLSTLELPEAVAEAGALAVATSRVAGAALGQDAVEGRAREWEAVGLPQRLIAHPLHLVDGDGGLRRVLHVNAHHRRHAWEGTRQRSGQRKPHPPKQQQASLAQPHTPHMPTTLQTAAAAAPCASSQGSAAQWCSLGGVGQDPSVRTGAAGGGWSPTSA